MNHWIPYAFVRIVLFFMLGVSVGIFYPGLQDDRFAKLIFLSAFLAYVIITVKVWRKDSRRKATNLKVCAGVVGLTAIFFAGLIRISTHIESRKPDHLVNISSPIDFFKVVVTAAAVEKANSWKTEAVADAVKTTGDEWRPARGKVMLYLSKDDFTTPVEYGDILVIKGAPQPVPPPSNPEEFDYRRFFGFKNIYHQKFVREDDVRKIGFAPPDWIDYYALQTRKWADNTIRENIPGHREKGLASALVLGITDGLDNELLSAYKATGTLHVLAVSGLHVGILYGIVLLILKPLKKLKSGPWTILVISIIVLWAYAFVTGLSPSVLRAVTMFSFVALAKPGGHRTNIYNTLAASAFFILWYDPFLIMSVGFQLSYLAVLGIVYMQSGLYNLWNPTNRILDEIWKVSCVSVAAQLATFPLGLFYFHQFPNYFLLSNLVAIPGSFVVLVLGLATLATAFILPVASALGLLLEWIIKAMNSIMFIFGDLPLSLIENVYITPLQCWILIGLLLAVLLLLRTRKFVWVKVVFFTGIILSGTQWYRYSEEVNVRKLTVYNIAGHSALDLIDNGQVIFIGDSLLRNQPEKITFHIAANRIRSGAKEIHQGYPIRQNCAGCSLMVWNEKSVLQINKPGFSLPGKLKVDYVIVSNNAVNNLDELLKQITAKKLILDSSNAKYNVAKLIRESRNIDTEIYSVAHKGAFELKI